MVRRSRPDETRQYVHHPRRLPARVRLPVAVQEVSNDISDRHRKVVVSVRSMSSASERKNPAEPGRKHGGAYISIFLTDFVLFSAVVVLATGIVLVVTSLLS